MPLLERTELEKSPLSDLHALASELGVEGYRRLRKDDLIDAIVGSQGGGAPAEAQSGATAEDADRERAGDSRRRRGGRGRGRRREAASGERSRDEASGEEATDEDAAEEDAGEQEPRTGTLDILPNGSGFLRADPFAHAPDDIYVAPAQVRRFELRTGDELTGPVRSPRRSERYPSLVRVESVNGGPAEPPAERPLFSDLTPCFARERLTAPEELERTPFGKGSRVAVAGPPGAGATTLLRRIAATLAERHPEVDLTVVLAGVRPEEVAEWRGQIQAPVAGGSFDESADRQGEIASTAIERAKRTAERGRDAAVIVDSLELLPGAAIRRVFGAARNTEEAGSVTVIAATGIGPEPARHATTRIVLQPGAGGVSVDADTSLTLRSDLL